jgi:hypothetical protein
MTRKGTATAPAVDLDQGFLPGRSRRVPLLVSDLLVALGVAKKSRRKQEEAVGDWLAANKPNRLLRDDLEDHGFVS